METTAICSNEFCTFGIADLYILHLVIVLRIIHTEDRLDNDTRLRFYILGIEVHLVCMKRADAIRCIQEISLLLIGNDVDGTAQGIASQIGRNHSFKNFYAVDDVGRKIGQGNSRPFGIQWHPVQEITDGITGHTINGQVEV